MAVTEETIAVVKFAAQRWQRYQAAKRRLMMARIKYTLRLCHVGQVQSAEAAFRNAEAMLEDVANEVQSLGGAKA